MEGLSAMDIEWILNAMDYGIIYFWSRTDNKCVF